MSLKSLIKATKNEFAFMADDENNPYDIKGYIDTGCYLLNAVLSDGDIFKGLPLGRRIALGGKSSTAKSLFTMYIIAAYLKNVPNSNVVMFESEGSSVLEMMEVFNVPKDRFLVLPVFTVEDWKTQFVNILEEIEKEKIKVKAKNENIKSKAKLSGETPALEPEPEYLIAIDSLGMLGSKKETEDALSGKQVQDMTRAKAVKSVYRLVTLKLSMLGIPHIVVNHTYDTQEMYSQEVISGGTGLHYAGDVIGILTKAKEKDGTEQVGAVITFNVKKSRFMQENKKVKILLHFRKGVYKWSGLLELGIELDVIKKEGISYIFPDGQKARKATIQAKPEEFWNEQNLQIIRDAIKNNFGFTRSDIDDTGFEGLDMEDEEC